MYQKVIYLIDATSESGLKFTNWFSKRTGNASAIMYFGINDSKEFADKCGMQLLEEKAGNDSSFKIKLRSCKISV